MCTSLKSYFLQLGLTNSLVVILKAELVLTKHPIIETRSLLHLEQFSVPVSEEFAGAGRRDEALVGHVAEHEALGADELQRGGQSHRHGLAVLT